MVLNEWTADETAKVPAMPVVELPHLHPVVARGVVEWLNDETHRLPPGAWRSVMKYAASIAARANT